MDKLEEWSKWIKGEIQANEKEFDRIELELFFK